ncbi:hypothetical protein GLOIN_2v1766614 [Rhizophagus irregularis DAOM 181602=DAOM 197198]|uniref:Zinc-ribbon domain-containing protein n=1 Tax=Rhizophagus irregularis (strain DAOM 181602 / DAOM 197198 / MUCL 43194) TaxID=747089 RepID=U9UXJ3_RHIID|nr:hypothetical protein GLOIN_2v1766614 [Rhizophagus irregularis DAOM 181602=DAOM 197198]
MGLPYHYNSRAKLEWICENKHRWEAVPNGIQQGSWCPYCVGVIHISNYLYPDFAGIRDRISIILLPSSAKLISGVGSKKALFSSIDFQHSIYITKILLCMAISKMDLVFPALKLHKEDGKLSLK